MNIEYMLEVFNSVPCIEPDEAYEKYFHDCIEYLKKCPQKYANEKTKDFGNTPMDEKKPEHVLYMEECNDKKLLGWMISWSKFFDDFLVEANVIDNVSNAFEELFFFYTSDFKLSGGYFPEENYYVGIIIDHFYKDYQKCLFFKDNYADLFLEKRFANPSSYVDYAWLIIFFNTKKRGHYVCPFNYKASLFLEKLINDQSWLDIGYDVILKKIMDNPNDEKLLIFWSNTFELVDYHAIYKMNV